MKATVVDLRRRMNDVLKALDRNEDVTVLYHGRPRGVLTARVVGEREGEVAAHPFFNMRRGELSVDEEMNTLRGERHSDL